MSIRFLISLFTLLWPLPQVRVPGPGGLSGASGASGGGSYTHQYTITLGNSSQVPATQTNFTTLVCANMTTGIGAPCFNSTGLNVTGSGGAVTSTNADDIVFSTTVCSNPTLMSWEMVAYTGSTGAMEAWVNVPSLAAGGVFYMCVGNAAITTFQGATAGAAWNSNYFSVNHFQTGSFLLDSSGNNTFTVGSGSTGSGTGIFNAGSQNSAGWFSSSTNLNTSQVTFEFWLNPTVINTTDYGILSAPGPDWAIGFDVGNKIRFSWGSGVTGTSAIATSTWTHVAGVADASHIYLYINGASSVTPVATSHTTNFDVQLFRNSGSSTFVADEVRVSTTALSANWIATEYNNQSAPASFMTMSLTY